MAKANVPGRVLLIVVGAVAAGVFAFQQSHGGRPPGLVRQFVGAGRWQSHRDRTKRESWQLQMKRFDDNSLSGRVVVAGSPLMDHAAIQGQLSGPEVDGVLLDDDGRQIGTFSGAIGTSGIAGTYATADGDAGDWSWEGSVPN